MLITLPMYANKQVLEPGTPECLKPIAWCMYVYIPLTQTGSHPHMACCYRPPSHLELVDFYGECRCHGLGDGLAKASV